MDGDDDQPKGVYLDNNRLISLLLGIVSVLLVAYCTVLWSGEQQMRQDFNAYVLARANSDRDYLKRDDLVEINGRLQRMEDKIDKLSPRP